MRQDETVGEGAIGTACAFFTQQNDATRRVAPTCVINVAVNARHHARGAVGKGDLRARW
jgi:hypothetical protein